jgi:p38 MAP kinase
MKMCVLHDTVKSGNDLIDSQIINLTDIFISPSEDVYETLTFYTHRKRKTLKNDRYIVTELMATDLNSILNSKKVEDQFAQYFMYQLMVGLNLLDKHSRQT